MDNPQADFTLTASRVLPAKPLDILQLLIRVEQFPQYLAQIKDCYVVDRDHLKVTTLWKVELDGMPITWKEEAVLDPRDRTVMFKAVEGDLEKFEGLWRLMPHPSGGTELRVDARIGIGIPVLSHIVGDKILAKVREFFENLLASFEEQISARRYGMIGDRKTRDISGFAVIGHPYNYQHLLRYLKSFNPDFKVPSREFLSKVFDMMPSYVSHNVREFRAASGKMTHGAFIACNIIPDMLTSNIDKVVQKVVESCKVAERLGLGILTLGGFTSIAGEKYGDKFRDKVRIPVTTGNTLTAALAVEGVLKAAGLMEVDLSRAKLTVVGGTGDIGSACARELARYVKEVTVTSRTPANLKKMEKVIKSVKGARFRGSHDNNQAVKHADIVVTAAGASQSLLKIENFKPGAIVCDVGYPKNIAYTKTDRKDLLIFAGGLCESPVSFDTGFDIGLPSSNILYGCFTESILLALEERYENYSWGKGQISREKMDEILALAKKHGFKLAPFFWGERQLTDEEVRSIRSQAT